MKILEFPLLCRRIDENTILGQIIGLDKQLVSDDIRGLTGDFSEYIEKQLQRGAYYEPEILQPRIKTLKLIIRPHYQEKQRIYPVKESIEFPVYAVYGGNEQGFFECFLPLLDKSFYFYSEKDLDKLIEHFAKDVLHNMDPGKIYSLLQSSAPWLESVTVKVPRVEQPKTKADDFSHLQMLNSVAERLPYARKSTRLVLDAAWERGEFVDKLISFLLTGKNNVLLVGNSGVGKSTIIHEAIRKIHQQEKSQEDFERHSFWRTTPARITAKAKYLGEWQENCEELVSDLVHANGIVWIENFVMLALTGGEGPEDSVAAFLTSFIRQKQLQMISEVTPEQLDVMRKLLPGFVDHFQILPVQEMNTATMLKIFDYFTAHAEKHQKVSFSHQALETVYMLLDRFVRYERFPGKAIRFLNQCVNKALQTQQSIIDPQVVIKNFSRQTGLPDILLRDDLLLDNKVLRKHFSDRIKGQDHILDKIISVIKVFKAGLNDPNKPIASMIFAGPTGVGKTATAQTLADYFFGISQTYQPLIRLDMSEFQHPGQIYRLIGAEGKLVQFVREKPFCVVLLDEIEKAHPLIFDALLTVLDEGILIDSTGRVTDFRNSIIIMTSNLGASQRGSVGFRTYQTNDFEAGIKAFFRPEFFNRIDLILPFYALDQDTIREITLYELSHIGTRDGIKNRGLKLSYTDELVYYIAEKGFDKKYGARPLQREIERLIVAPLARLILQRPELYNQEVLIGYEKDSVVFV
ncbi:AAA family ATPase [Cytophagaceae bacterium YF14B1]|uniref:AAA family ATPase n=1 Tax=Xanthocytophaga flava TaxID=3048013 RepID=A0AAE3QME3_9BACT|nr:AAA family ATPase [Xanthocytophaga flavus]MDJ1482032.1 AAA family ATPase [Xanthocytophaga flavus]